MVERSQLRRFSDFEFPSDFREGYKFELGINNNGAPASINQIQRALNQVSFIRNCSVFVARYEKWLQNKQSISNVLQQAFHELNEIISIIPEYGDKNFAAEVIRESSRFIKIMREFEPSKLSPPGETWPSARIQMNAAYHENPTWAQLGAIGSSVAVLILVTVMAHGHIVQNLNEVHCRDAQVQHVREVRGMLQQQARLEGRWTPQHATTLEATEKAAGLAMEACRAKGFSFDLRPGWRDARLTVGPAGRQ